MQAHTASSTRWHLIWLCVQPISATMCFGLFDGAGRCATARFGDGFLCLFGAGRGVLGKQIDHIFCVDLGVPDVKDGHVGGLKHHVTIDARHDLGQFGTGFGIKVVARPATTALAVRRFRSHSKRHQTQIESFLSVDLEARRVKACLDCQACGTMSSGLPSVHQSSPSVQSWQPRTRCRRHYCSDVHCHRAAHHLSPSPCRRSVARR